jgi:hypothetical protein
VPPTTAASTTTVAGSVRAVDVLASIPIQPETNVADQLDRFGFPADQDNDGCNTRDEVLQRDSLVPAQVASPCQVIAGRWLSAYDNQTVTDPNALDVAHTVALSEAWDSGASSWATGRLVAFGNDLDDARSLRAITRNVNADKGGKDPAEWLPPHQPAVCQYLADWIAIKARWGLSMDQAEHDRISSEVGSLCPNLVIGPWPAAPAG